MDQPLLEYLQTLGIEPTATRAYLALAKLGPASALQLAKTTKISRTQIYRHIELLQKFGLVSQEALTYGTLFRALPLENIQATLAQREAETQTLKANLHDMATLLGTLNGDSGPTATTQHYYGLAGIKQANWNLTKAHKEYRVFEAAHLSAHLDASFARRCRERYIEKQLTSYDITNRTEVFATDLEPYAPSRTFYRHLPPETLNIEFEMYIYNDVVALLDYQKDHEHVLEIHHPTLYRMMIQLFEAMWQLGAPIAIIE
jgi:sugar-specific transcriptional regulator TrmB